MFDIAFSELLVIGVIALIVIGPERLPKVARTAGQWLGKLNRYVSQVKQDIDRDIKLDELRKMQNEMQETAQKYEILAKESARQVETTVKEEVSQVDQAMKAVSASDGDSDKRENAATAVDIHGPAQLTNAVADVSVPDPTERTVNEGDTADKAVQGQEQTRSNPASNPIDKTG